MQKVRIASAFGQYHRAQKNKFTWCKKYTSLPLLASITVHKKKKFSATSCADSLVHRRFFFYAGFWRSAKGHRKAEKRVFPFSALRSLWSLPVGIRCRIKNLKSAWARDSCMEMLPVLLSLKSQMAIFESVSSAILEYGNLAKVNA